MSELEIFTGMICTIAGITIGYRLDKNYSELLKWAVAVARGEIKVTQSLPDPELLALLGKYRDKGHLSFNEIKKSLDLLHEDQTFPEGAKLMMIFALGAMSIYEAKSR